MMDDKLKWWEMLLNVKNGSAQKGFQEGKSFEYELNIKLCSQHGKSKGTIIDTKITS